MGLDTYVDDFANSSIGVVAGLPAPAGSIDGRVVWDGRGQGKARPDGYLRQGVGDPPFHTDIGGLARRIAHRHDGSIRHTMRITALAAGILLPGCSGCKREPEPVAPVVPEAPAIVEILEEALTRLSGGKQLSDEERHQAERAMAKTIGDPWDEVKGSGQKTIAVVPVAKGSVVLQHVADTAARARLTLIQKSGWSPAA